MSMSMSVRAEAHAPLYCSAVCEKWFGKCLYSSGAAGFLLLNHYTHLSSHSNTLALHSTMVHPVCVQSVCASEPPALWGPMWWADLESKDSIKSGVSKVYILEHESLWTLVIVLKIGSKKKKWWHENIFGCKLITFIWEKVKTFSFICGLFRK